MLIFFLIKLATQYIKKYNPKIIGIVSNLADTTTARAMCRVLGDSVKMIGDHNNYLDLLLNLINGKKRPSTILGWLVLICQAKWRLLVKSRDYPLIMILDFSRVKFKEMSQLLEFLRFDAAVINKLKPIEQNKPDKTKVAEPVLSADKNCPTFADEAKQRRIEWKKKNKILSILDSRGWAILNIDDQEIFDLSPKTKAQIFSFSQKIKADLRSLEILELDDASGFRASVQNQLNVKRRPGGLSFKLIYKGSVMPIKLPKISAPKKIPAVLAGVSVGLWQGLDMVKIAERVEALE